MFSHVRARRLACAALILLFAQRAHAGPVTIDLPTALARARERAPEAVAALARIGEARAKRTGAGVLFTQNTELQVGAGRRFGDPRTTAIQAQLTQPLELTRRGPRIGVADAEVAHAQALNDAELRELSYEVASIFYEARFADFAVELAQRNQEVAARAAEAADRRRKAGDITDLDVNLAKIALGRARSTLAATRAERAEAISRLGALIGAQPDDTITLAGDLKPAAFTLDSLRSAVPARADVRAIEAESRVARAEGALANANGRPDVGLWFGYQLDEDDSILLGGLNFPLPFWNRAQGDKAAARAKLRRSELERAAVVTAASRQVVDAFEAYTRAREGVEIFERDVLPTVIDSEKLLDRSIDTGQITINAYLVAREEILSGRREYLERQLQLAKAAASARFVAGVAP
jgi:cobalt-zinc-cadmium efflux system outer membrane protein